MQDVVLVRTGPQRRPPAVGSAASEAMDLRVLPAEPLVSCLCVTENRHAFIPWLLWNYDRQQWKRRELVIVESSDEPLELPERADVRVLRAPPGTTCGKARNLALKAAAGDMLAWFDDDDWQHPERLTRLVPTLRTSAETLGAAYVGPSHGWFLNVDGSGCQPYHRPEYAIFNGSLFLTALAREQPFPEERARAEDTRWLARLVEAHPGASLVEADPVLFVWLSHDANGCNPRHTLRLGEDATALRRRIGSAWGDTSKQLDELRERLVASPPPIRFPRLHDVLRRGLQRPERRRAQ